MDKYIAKGKMPQLNSDEAANDEPTAYSEECGDDDRWNENLSDIKVDLVEDIDKYPRRVSTDRFS